MQSTAPPVEPAQWLSGPEAQKWLAEAAEWSGNPLQLQRWLRRSLPPWQAQRVAQQVELRRRAARKFSRASQMLFTPRGLEQATDETIALYKGKRFPAGRVVDLCCGVGGDLIGLAHAHAAIGVDMDPTVATLAHWNLRQYAREDCTVACQVADRAILEGCQAWHVDPDRRAHGKRTIHPADMNPNLETLRSWLRDFPNAAIKLAPASPESGWPTGAVREWIGHRGECQQQVVWTGSLAWEGFPRRATLLEPSGENHSIDGTGTESLRAANGVGRWIYEPAAPVLAAGLVGQLANDCGLEQLGSRGGYLTGDHFLRSPLLFPFQVLEVVPGRLSDVRSIVKRYQPSHLEIKKRGVDWPQMPWLPGGAKTGRALTLLITQVGKHRRAVLASRWSV
jgi:hypothetical protein